jgi:hypothetical protein
LQLPEGRVVVAAWGATGLPVLCWVGLAEGGVPAVVGLTLAVAEVLGEVGRAIRGKENLVFRR